jgi:ribokinase
MPGPIVIIGSINMDLVCRTRAIPRPGETVLGSDFVTLPGGKGANQAVAAARLADGRAKVHMVGRVGDDDFGIQLLAGLDDNDVDTSHVTVMPGVASGVAMIVVDAKGENSIVVTPGANARVTPADVDAAEDLIASASAVVMQLEIPLPTVRHAIAMCQRHEVFTILDPAPVSVPVRGKPLPRTFFGVDVLTPNQTEAALLLGFQSSGKRTRRAIDPKQVAGDLLARGARTVVLKLGSKGCVLAGRDGSFRAARPPRVRVVDTTAAGDAFTAGLAVGRAMGWPPGETLAFANAAGAVCCMTFGAQPSLPTRLAVEKILATD